MRKAGFTEGGARERHADKAENSRTGRRNLHPRLTLCDRTRRRIGGGHPRYDRPRMLAPSWRAALRPAAAWCTDRGDARGGDFCAACDGAGRRAGVRALRAAFSRFPAASASAENPPRRKIRRNWRRGCCGPATLPLGASGEMVASSAAPHRPALPAASPVESPATSFEAGPPGPCLVCRAPYLWLQKTPGRSFHSTVNVAR